MMSNKNTEREYEGKIFTIRLRGIIIIKTNALQW